jgi:hypothetical protein
VEEAGGLSSLKPEVNRFWPSGGAWVPSLVADEHTLEENGEGYPSPLSILVLITLFLLSLSLLEGKRERE